MEGSLSCHALSLHENRLCTTSKPLITTENVLAIKSGSLYRQQYHRHLFHTWATVLLVRVAHVWNKCLWTVPFNIHTWSSFDQRVRLINLYIAFRSVREYLTYIRTSTLPGKRLQNLDQSSAFSIFERRDLYRAIPTIWHGTSVYMVSSARPSASIDKPCRDTMPYIHDLS